MKTKDEKRITDSWEQIASSFNNKRESEIKAFCKEHRLNYDDAADYAKAAVAFLEYMPPISEFEVAIISNLLHGDILNGNPVQGQPCGMTFFAPCPDHP